MQSNQPTAIIFGGTGAIGSALVRRLAKQGWAVTEASRSSKERSTDGNLAIPCDVTVADQVQTVIDRTNNAFGRVDAVANCCGSILLKPGHLLTDEEWSSTLSVNLNSCFYILRSAAKAMMRTGGSIAFVSTAAARTGIANHEAISAAKSGIEGLVRSAAATYAPKRLRINAVAPGLVRSRMSSHLIKHEAMLESSTAMHALGRIGEADDVASALAWFLDPAQSWVTGQILGVDGGLAHLRPRPVARTTSPPRSPSIANAP